MVYVKKRYLSCQSAYTKQNISSLIIIIYLQLFYAHLNSIDHIVSDLLQRLVNQGILFCVFGTMRSAL